MGFFDDPPAVAPNKFDADCAQRLHKFLKSNHRLKIPFSSRSWAAEFAKLRKSEIDEQQIKTALDFYIQNFRRKYVPLVFSASGFRKKFMRIQAAIRRRKYEIEIREEIEITPAARQVAADAGGLEWPKSEKRDELKFIQICLNRYNAFTAGLYSALRAESRSAELEEQRQLAESGAVKSTVWEFALLLENLYRWLPPAEEYVTAWLVRAHGMAWGWAGWDGNLLKHAWRPTHREFRRYVGGHLADYCGDSGAFVGVLAAVEKR